MQMPQNINTNQLQFVHTWLQEANVFFDNKQCIDE